MLLILTILIAANVMAIIFAGLRMNAKHIAERNYWANRIPPLPSGSCDRSSR